jgi:transcriptional regulator with PAS, ATPase and Fis domain
MASPRLVSASYLTSRIHGTSAAIGALRGQIHRLAAFDTLGSPLVPTILLQGETGTGKGLVARVLHESGPRVEGPFLEVNCAAIPETLLEAELFGFEAGAFTDAKRPKPGLFEAASGGRSSWTKSMPSRWHCRARCSRPSKRSAYGGSAP